MFFFLKKVAKSKQIFFSTFVLIDVNVKKHVTIIGEKKTSFDFCKNRISFAIGREKTNISNS
jgi:hypothetical protein